ncbi:MAG: TonB family protein [Cyclobacteriaceae bacterium]|nr:TonB family protein [Cyclobacteriaceae bacterium]
MSKKLNHPEFPDRDTLLEYLKGGLSYQERHRIEKLMQEHEFFREVVEGLESENPGMIEDDLTGLSRTLRERSGLQSGTGFNFYRMAASISLIIMASVIIFVTVERITRSEQEDKLSDAQLADTSRVVKILKPSPEIEGLKELTESAAGKENPSTREMDKEPSRKLTDDQSAPISEVLPDKEQLTVLKQSERISAREIETPEDISVKTEQDMLSLQKKIEPVKEEEVRHLRKGPAGIARLTQVDEVSEVPPGETTPGMAMPYMSDTDLPQPLDGYEVYEKYLEDSLQYPESALDHQVQGVVIVTFTVGRDSIPDHFSLKKSLGYGCDEEAIRLIRNGPKWKPAIAGGNIVDSELEIPVKFTLPP